MIALKILFYILNKNDPILLTKIDTNWILDAKVKDLYEQVLEFQEKQKTLPSIDHLIDINDSPELFKDITLLPKDSILYYISELEEQFHKYTYFDELYKTIDNSEISSFEELIDSHQNLLLTAQKTMDSDLVEIDCANSPDPEELIFKKPVGLGKFDRVNGGMASSELMLLGGYRGTGKSVLALNCAINRFLSGQTAAFISIEMRSIEVLNRVDSIITGIPIKVIETNSMTEDQLKQFYFEKTKHFCQSDAEDVQNFVKNILSKPNISRGTLEQVYKGLTRKKNKLYLYDLPNCTPSNINYIAAKLKKTANLSLLIVDYLNIIKMPNYNTKDYDPLGWKAQIARSEILKTTARTNDVAIISPIQISEEGKIKFARAIEDVVDISLLFQRSKSSSNNILSLKTSKIRNGKELDFVLTMDSDTLRVSEFNKEEEK